MNTKDNGDVLAVTVVIPTFNGQNYIAEALRSVFAQSRLPKEIIVVDDSSTDDTTRLVEEAAISAPVPVKLVRLPRNSGGPALPINVGIETATSPLIAVLDQDDIFLPKKIDRQAALLSAHPEVALVFSYGGAKQEPNTSAAEYLSKKQYDRLGYVMASDGDKVSCDGPSALRVLVNHGNCIGGFPAFTFRREDWQTIGGLDERLAGAADYDLLCRLCQKGQVAAFPEVHYIHRFHGANLSGSGFLADTDRIKTLAKFANCKAWPTVAGEVRQAIHQILYTLAIQLDVVGAATAARPLRRTSFLLGGLRPGSLLRAVDYPLKVFRRKRRGCHAQFSSQELRRAIDSTRTVGSLYRRRWWRLWLGDEPSHEFTATTTRRNSDQRHAA